VQPRKLGVQSENGFGGGFPGYRTGRRNCGRHGQQGATGALVAAISPTTTGTQAAHLLGGFVEEDIGVFGHGVSPGTTFIAQVEGTPQVAREGSEQILPLKRRWLASGNRNNR
jgi:hypothetical protein